MLQSTMACDCGVAPCSAPQTLSAVEIQTEAPCSAGSAVVPTRTLRTAPGVIGPELKHLAPRRSAGATKVEAVGKLVVHSPSQTAPVKP